MIKRINALMQAVLRLVRGPVVVLGWQPVLIRPRVRVRASLVTRVASRAVSFVVAVVGLAIAAPLMVVIALIVKVSSRGPVLVRQVRVGVNRRKWVTSPTIAVPGVRMRRRRSEDSTALAPNLGGRPFTALRFRTASQTVAVGRPNATTLARVERRTPVGHVLRQLRLDELPQLVNVLLGDTNVIGPSIEQPRIEATPSTLIRQYGTAETRAMKREDAPVG